MVDDLEQTIQNARVEALAKFLRRVDKRRDEDIHSIYRAHGGSGNYVFPVPQLAEVSHSLIGFIFIFILSSI